MWKYHIEIIFEAKKVLKVVFGFDKRIIPIDPKNIIFEELIKLDTWDEKNANA